MILRRTTILLLSAATFIVACVDLSAPKGPASISLIRLPAAFVVRGDVMRDSSGAPALPFVNEFDAAGHLIPGAAPQFFITDSAPAAHFDPATGQLVGDRLGLVHFIGQVGSLQTPSVEVAITVAPESIAVAAGGKDTLEPPLSRDTTAGDSTIVPVAAFGLGDSTVQGVVIRYALTRTLASNDPTRPAVSLDDPTGKPTTTDTTGASGVTTSHLYLVVHSSRLADLSLASGQKLDSVIVQASASYRGTPLVGSPLMRVVYVTGTLGSP